MNWSAPLTLNGNMISLAITQPAGGGPTSVTMTSTVNGTQMQTKTVVF